LEKLANILESLAKELAVYTALVDLWTKFSLKPSAQFRSSLERVYVDLFQFYQSVARMFLLIGSLCADFRKEELV